MTSANTDATNPRSFSNTFFTALLHVLTEAGGTPWKNVEIPEADVPRDSLEPVAVKLTLDGSLTGDFILEFSRAEAAILASKILKTPSAEFGAEQSKALVKLIASAADLFRTELGNEYGEFTIKAAAVTESAPDRSNMFQLSASDENGDRASVWMYMDAALTEELARHLQTHGPGAEIGRAINAARGNEKGEPVNLNLVMDVELNVTLRFGQRKLTLREVLELTSGSVVELDRQVEEPVELLLDGMVIARGEAVVIDGNYGLRVTEVSRPLASAVLR
jgi:flagellar motor switch protein FliN/FliY